MRKMRSWIGVQKAQMCAAHQTASDSDARKLLQQILARVNINNMHGEENEIVGVALRGVENWLLHKNMKYYVR